MRTSSSQQQQIDKHKKLAEEAKAKTDSLENQLSAVKKVFISRCFPIPPLFTMGILYGCAKISIICGRDDIFGQKNC